MPILIHEKNAEGVNSPKIPPDAPTEIVSGRKMALRIIPPIAEREKIRKDANQPWLISMAAPTKRNANIFIIQCTKPAYVVDLSNQ